MSRTSSLAWSQSLPWDLCPALDEATASKNPVLWSSQKKDKVEGGETGKIFPVFSSTVVLVLGEFTEEGLSPRQMTLQSWE